MSHHMNDDDSDPEAARPRRRSSDNRGPDWKWIVALMVMLGGGAWTLIKDGGAYYATSLEGRMATMERETRDERSRRDIERVKADAAIAALAVQITTIDERGQKMDARAERTAKLVWKIARKLNIEVSE